MIIDRSRSRRDDSGRLPALVTLLLLAVGSPAAGAEGARLELFHGPDQAGTMTLKNLRIVLDGKDLGVTVPAVDADPETALFSGAVEPGVHKLEVEASLESANSLFSYVDAYRIKLRSMLEVEVLPGKGVAIRSRILPRGGITTQWSDQNKLVLTLSEGDGQAAPTVAVATAERTSPAALAAPAVPAASASPRPPSTAPALAQESVPARTADEGVPATAAEPDRAKRVAVAAAPSPADAPEPPPAPPSPAASAPRTASEPARAAAGDCQLAALRFDFDKTSLPDEAREKLDRFASCAAARRFHVRVEGHSDSRGSDEYNRWLAWDRAASVSAYLREHGLTDRRIITRSQGATRPLCQEATQDCFARNRRVEVITAQ